MKNRTFGKYYTFSLFITLLISLYPLYMGICVVRDMIISGTVLGESYPKYIIPYTPISLSVIIGVAVMPLAIKYLKSFALFSASALSLGIFFLSEWLLESKVIVTTTTETTLESWQMYMCYQTPEMFETKTLTAADILIGEYSPAFKLHFYVISIVLILSALNCFYGFANMIKNNDKSRLKSLVMQTVAAILFLGLCILACFTAFFRTGEIQVSAISAVLMGIFFVVFGVTFGIYVGSFLLNKKRRTLILVPCIVSMIITFVMYIGEMILLSGHLYRFGSGFLFDGLGSIALAPIDILIIIASGCITAGLMTMLGKKKK